MRRIRCLRLATATAIAAAILALLAGTVRAEDRLAHIFQDNMVLQRDKPVPVWGWAAPGTQVEVGFAGQKKQAVADDRGYWKAVLDPLAASREGRPLEVRIGNTTISRKNVLVGEVWLTSGQSNMVAGGSDADSGVYPHYVSPGTQGGKPEIRIVRFGWGASVEPLEDADPAVRGNKPWELLTEDPPMKSGAIPQYFARVVRDALDVPVGIIQVAVPGTPLAAWMSREALETAGGLSMIDGASARRPSAEALKAAEAEWRETKKGNWPRDFQSNPSVLYNTRVHPLAPFAFRGALWHQGEAGTSAKGVVAMVRQWRTQFGQEFDFIVGTLSRSTAEAPPLTPWRSGFYRSGANGALHQALTLFGDDPHVALVELYDLGNDGTHFTMKAEAGRRMALAALSLSYGKPAIYTGPRLASSAVDGGKATLKFEHVGDGLVHRPSIDGISGVFLRGKSGAVRWGQVKLLDASTVEASHPDITDLETVAYAAHPNPHETLFNSAGLPASPFTVNGTKTRDKEPTLAMVKRLGTEPEVNLHVAHVRREGYVFSVRKDKSPSAPYRVQAYIPAEWKSYGVESDGKALAVEELTKDGQRFVTFDATLNGPWVIVAERGKEATLRKVNRF